jgi:regulatory protein
MTEPDAIPAPAGTAATAGTAAEIRRAAMNLLARREHSLGELRQKLRRQFDDEAMLEAQLQKLAGEKLQSDDRYAESFARLRALRGYGPARVRQEMRTKSISDTVIARALAAAVPDWSVLAQEVFGKKFGAPGPVDLKEKARRARFMQYRGFSSDHYQHLLDN